MNHKKYCNYSSHRLPRTTFCNLEYGKVTAKSVKPDHMSGVMKKNGQDQMCSNCTVDKRFCFLYTDSSIPPLCTSEISSF